ncbi:MAG: exonuclease subunit SbcD [Verrucomicrobiota bacterium]
MADHPVKKSSAYRVLHTADWHLGKSLRDLSRDEEHARFLDWLADFILKSETDLLVVAGDIFDSANPPQQALRRYHEFIARVYRETHAEILIVGGNHDSPALLESSASVLTQLRCRIVGQAPSAPANCILTFPQDTPKIAVAAIPFLRDRDLRKGVSGETSAEIRSAIVAGIANYYEAATQAAPPDLPLLATGHLTVTGSSTSDSERDIHIGGLGDIAADRFPEQIDYLALGHLHRPQRCGKRSNFRYSGSPIPLSFSEASDEKSLQLLDFVESELIEQHTIPIPAYRALLRVKAKRSSIRTALADLELPDTPLRPWLEIQIKDPVPGEDLFQECLEASEAIDADVIQVTAIGQTAAILDESEIDESETHRLLEDPTAVFQRRLEMADQLDLDERETLELTFTKLLEAHQSGDPISA